MNHDRQIVHPLEVRHHFGCCKQIVSMPLARLAELVEIVQAHDCPHKDEDAPPPPRVRVRPRNPMTQRNAAGETILSPLGHQRAKAGR